MAELLTTTEFLILKAVQLQAGNGYGVTIRAEIKDQTGRDFSYGTIYKTLRRLEKKGYVDSRMGEKTEERGGRAKEYFAVNGVGIRALDETEATITRFGKVAVAVSLVVMLGLGVMALPVEVLAFGGDGGGGSGDLGGRNSFLQMLPALLPILIGMALAVYSFTAGDRNSRRVFSLWFAGMKLRVKDYISANPSEPPKLLDFLLYCLLSKSERESVPGDLAEEYFTVILPKFGRLLADLWYTCMVIRSVGPLLWMGAERVVDAVRKIIPFAGR